MPPAILNNFSFSFVFYVAVIFVSSQKAMADDLCIQSEIRSQVFGKTKKIQSSFCYSDSLESFRSMSCKDQMKCLAFKQINKILPLKAEQINSAQGSPGALICEKLGGVFEFIEYKINSEWVESDRCLFDDNSFVTTGTLVRENRDREKSQDSKSKGR